MSEGRIAEGFGSTDAEERRQAVIALAEQPTKDTVGWLVRGLGDPDWRVRKESVRVAIDLAPRIGTAALIEAVSQGENVGLRNAAIEALGRLGDLAGPDLIAALEKAPPRARKFLVEAVGEAGFAPAVSVLADFAQGDDANTAAAALDALARLGGREAELALRRRLRSPDLFQRVAALDGLARLEAVVPWEEIEPLLGDRVVRRGAIAVLGRCGAPAAVLPLVDALSDRSPHVVAAAAVSLVRLYDSSDATAAVVGDHLQSIGGRARQSLREILLDGDLASRQAVAQLLVIARDEAALEGAISLAAEGTLPPEAFSALAEWGVAAARPLLELERRSHGAVRGAALEVASDLAAEARAQGTVDERFVDELRSRVRGALASSEPAVARAAVRSLAFWGSGEDAARVVALANTQDEDLAVACARAIEALSERSPDAVRASLSGLVLEGSRGAALAEVVARLGGADAVVQLQTGLSAQQPEVRRACVGALALIGGERAAELIAFALADEDMSVRTAAARVLGHLRDDAGRPLGSSALLLALDAESPAVQAAAARALGESREGKAIEPLRELVRSVAPGVAVAAMESLRALGDPTIDELLVEALGHPDEEVVKQALRALRAAEGLRVESRLAVGLVHPAWHVRALAARLLGEIGTDSARASLERHRQSERDAMVQQAIDEVFGVGRG